MADTTPEGYGFADDTGPPRPKKPKVVRQRDRADDPPAPTPTPPAKKKPSPLWAIVFIAPLIAVAVFMAVRQHRQRSSEREAFAAEMDKLVAPPAAGPAKAKPGKVAIIDVDKRELHYLHDRNGGDDSQAATPAETATVVHVRTRNKEVCKYIDGRIGVKQTFHLTVVDKATWAKIDERSFEGGEPPTVTTGGGGTKEPVAGPLPAKEIYAYLKGLCGG